MKLNRLICALLGPLLVVSIYVNSANADSAKRTEGVLSPGMILMAITPSGTIQVRADANLVRYFTWDGATRSIKLFKHPKPWPAYISLVKDFSGRSIMV